MKSLNTHLKKHSINTSNSNIPQSNKQPNKGIKKAFAAQVENTNEIKREEKRYEGEPTFKYEKIDLSFKNSPHENGKIYERREKTPSRQNN